METTRYDSWTIFPWQLPSAKLPDFGVTRITSKGLFLATKRYLKHLINFFNYILWYPKYAPSTGILQTQNKGKLFYFT